MKPASTRALSGCLVCVVMFVALSIILCPVSVAVASLTAFSTSDFVPNLISPYLCPKGSTGEVRTQVTITTNADGSGPSTDYELICVDGSGTEVANTGATYAFIWIGVLGGVSLALAAGLSVLLVVPARTLIARGMSRRTGAAGAPGPA
jgi:hypothetical protein